MKKILFAFLLSITPLGAAISQVCETLRVSGSPVSPPSSWVQNGKLVGASVEYVEILAKQVGVKNLTFKVYDSWDKSLSAARSGEVDLIFGVAKSSGRSKYLSFISVPYTSQYLYAIVRKGETFKLAAYKDLKGRKGATDESESFGRSVFGHFVESDLTIQKTPDIGTSLDLLFAGQADYILAYENSAYYEVFKRGIADRITVLPTFPYRKDIYIAFSKNSECFDKLSKPFAEAISNSHNQQNIYFNLFKKYVSIFNSKF